MYIEVIPQMEIGGISRIRVGDFLNQIISNDDFRHFKFAVAYMRFAGWDRLGASIENLVNREGQISGVVGINAGITSIEALNGLMRVSNSSTVFYSTSSFIFHPKIYSISGEEKSVVLIGSANLTRDGLFRNFELATAIHLDFNDSIDFEVHNRYEAILNELLNTSHPNVQPLNSNTMSVLISNELVKPESQTKEPGEVSLHRGRRRVPANPEVESLFPPVSIPTAPPGYRAVTVIRRRPPRRRERVIVPPQVLGEVRTFIMKLSSFNSSHRTGVPGTAEVLIPHGAINFFPSLSITTRKYPDAMFDVVLNTSIGQERHHYRLWYYEERATGTRIDEYRLRMNKETIDLSSPGGGDLLVINRLPEGSAPMYEVTFLPQSDPTYPAFLALCTEETQGKRWGLA